MGMPIEITIEDYKNTKIFNEVFNFFKYVDQKFSTYKTSSEVSIFNQGKIKLKDTSDDFKKIYKLCQKSIKYTFGFFNPSNKGYYDPSGLVKGWAINEASNIIKKSGSKIYYINAGGDVQTSGKLWKIGIKNPFKQTENIKIINIKDSGLATSGNYERGMHIYNPQNNFKKADDIASITVIAKDVYLADIYSTAAFAIGLKGINLIEMTKGLEGYQIDKSGIATETSGFSKYLCLN